MSRFIDLVAIEGLDRGMRYAIDEGTYRVLARAPDERTSTHQMTSEGDRSLDVEQEELLERILARRSAGRSRTAYRKRGPDIVLRDQSVSRTHALVFCEATSVSVVDLMSTNGTRVNGASIKDVELVPGDVIHLGKTKLRIDEG